MNRQQRRKAERGRVRVGPGVVESIPGAYDQGSAATLPPKVAGRHRWIITAAYLVTEESVANEERAQAEGSFTPSFLDHETRFALNLGCWDCEQPWPEIKAGSRCPA